MHATAIQKFQLDKKILTQKIQFADFFFNATATFGVRSRQGHRNWYGSAKLKRRYHNAKFERLLHMIIILFSKLDVCEGGSFSSTICKSGIKLSISHISCFISVGSFVALSKAKFAENVHIVLSSPY